MSSVMKIINTGVSPTQFFNDIPKSHKKNLVIACLTLNRKDLTYMLQRVAAGFCLRLLLPTQAIMVKMHTHIICIRVLLNEEM